MNPTMAERHGEWANAGDAAAALLTQLTAGNLRRTGEFWEGVRAAHQQLRRGRGQKIAVLDSGFDLTRNTLAGVTCGLHTKSRSDEGAAHGTVVALLVREVAPDADLRVWDVSRRGAPNLERAAVALREACDWGADVVCCSFGFRADPTMNQKTPSIAEATDLELDPEAVVQILKDRAAGPWFLHLFGPGGCQSSCSICEVLNSLATGRPLIVCAAGNDAIMPMCPNIHQRALRAGFHLRIPNPIDGLRILEASGPPGFDQFRFPDIVLEAIPGCVGTSFASPLVAGYATLIGADEFEAVVRSSRIEEMASARHMKMNPTKGSVEVPELAARGTLLAYLAALDVLPAGHELDGHPASTPCPVCSFQAHRVYQNLGLLYLEGAQDDHAAWVLFRGKTVAPNAPGIQANIGALLLRRSRQTDGDLQGRVHDAIRAAAAWFEADRIEGGVQVYQRHAAEALDHAAAIGTMPAVPDLQGLDDAERGLTLPEGTVVGYSGEEANRFLMVLGRHLMNTQRYEEAVGPLARIVNNGTSPLVGLAALHLGVTYILLRHGVAAHTTLLRAEEVGDSTVRAYAKFNRMGLPYVSRLLAWIVRILSRSAQSRSPRSLGRTR